MGHSDGLVAFDPSRACEQAVLAFAGPKSPLPNGRALIGVKRYQYPDGGGG